MARGSSLCLFSFSQLETGCKLGVEGARKAGETVLEAFGTGGGKRKDKNSTFFVCTDIAKEVLLGKN